MIKTTRLMVPLLVLMTLAGCAGYLYKSPLEMFDHGEHRQIMLEKGYECIDCHRILTFKKRDFIRARRFSEISFYPRMHTCHSCHVALDTRIPKATGRCSECHVDSAAIKPDSHVTAWRELHSAEAKQNRQSCRECHGDWFCSDCHARRDPVRTLMHPRPYRFSHSVEAQIDPAKCSACHETSFCKDCHG